MHSNCKRCHFELVQVHKDTIKRIIDELNPNFLSLPSDWKSTESEWIPICPRCDQYCIGFPKQGYPIRTQSGDLTTINNMDFVVAHEHIDYQQEILNSEVCGCFYCCKTFSPDEIDQWHGEDQDEVEPQAICPHCSINSVIGSASGFPIEPTFLRKMHDYWFSPSELLETMGSSHE